MQYFMITSYLYVITGHSMQELVYGKGNCNLVSCCAVLNQWVQCSWNESKQITLLDLANNCTDYSVIFIRHS